MKPAHLTCDSLTEPLGLDAEKPQLSWQLQDSGFGAKQTAYRIEVATNPNSLGAGNADVWDSGKVASDRSVGVVYAGPALKAETRYYWRVMAWDKDGRPYAASDASWWETGLMAATNWKGKWIGYELEEERRIRESGAAWITNPSVQSYTKSERTEHDFRFPFSLSQPAKRAVLYVTGKDTAAAWMNGRQVIEAQPMPPWKQFPWQTYVKKEVTSDLHMGRNLLAVEITLYSANPGGANAANDSQTPMNACLYVELADGSIALFESGDGWKAALKGEGAWRSADYNDSDWAAAVPYVAPAGAGPTVGHPWPTESVKLLRRGFEVSSAVTSARLYVTSLGAYQMSLNGQRIGDQVLAPGWTDYREQVAYQAYDVSKNVKAGANVLGAYLAPGWYATPLMWLKQGYNYGDTPQALKAQLRIKHADGSVQWIVTDSSWMAEASPILKAEIYDGERYDARRAQAGWDTASFSDRAWKAAVEIQPVEPKIVAQYFPPVRVEKELPAKTITNPRPGVYIYDFAQNLAGVASIQAHGAAGTDVRLRFAEVLNPDGTLYTDNLRTAKATDDFILAGHGTEEYKPTFTFHGFRYVEVTGLNYKPELNAVKAVVFHTDAPLTARLRTGSAMINQLWENILWGQRSNFISVPTDCPQRDERLGWTADAQVFWRTASYNMDVTQFSKKFAADIRGTQSGTAMYGIYAPGTNIPNAGHGAGWSDAGVIIPWTGWLQSGDKQIIDENWEAMSKYLVSIELDNPDYLWSKNYGIPFGDWLSPEGPTKETLVATAYWAYDVTLMREMAHATGRSQDEAKYAGLFGKIQTAFAKTFVNDEGFINAADFGLSPFGQINNPDAKAKGKDTQTGYVLALEMNLLPESLRQAAADKLVGKIAENGWRLNTGFLGTPYLLAVLVDTGHADIAYRLLLNTEYPSWGYLVGHGATTMWERWNGDQMRGDPSMNSYNHYAYGSVADWIYRYAAGIDASPMDAGFHTVYLHPNFDLRLRSLDFSYDSLYGEIHSSWSMNGKHAKWRLTLPPNTNGELPADQVRSFTLNGARLDASNRVHLSTSAEGKQVYDLDAGSYIFDMIDLRHDRSMIWCGKRSVRALRCDESLLC